ncbi:ABC transporter permease [Gordonia asplenii]|uniref:ABC transporter permease n=1 Tax=Gordonia asplenii TaxID=2725283 RepID=UPI001FE2446C|nr:ABC transporter permease [Gordonia asplenii]
MNIRRERIISPVTVVLIVVINLSTAASVVSMYSTQQEKAALAASAGTNAAFSFLLGPLHHIDSNAAVVSWRAGLFMIAATAVCVALTVTRLTRKEEELGRVELVRSGATGALAPLTAALVVAVVVSVVVGVAMAILMVPLGAGVASAAAVGAQYTTTALAAAGLAAVGAQFAATSRIANMVAASVILGGYVLRGVGDIADGWSWLQWLSPMGWAERIDPFGANSWWPALASLAVFAASVGGAVWMSDRRDLGGGLLQPRPGPASTDKLSTMPAVATHLAIPGMASWASAITTYALVIGFLIPSINDIASSNPQITDYLEKLGGAGDLGTVFTSTMMGYLGFAAAAWAVTAVGRLRADESAGRTETLLATPISRSTYFIDQAVVLVIGIVVIMACAALGVGVADALVSGGWGAALGHAFSAAAVQIPAALVLAGIVAVLYGAKPAWTLGAWLVLIVAFLVGPLGALFNLPQWARDISPFTHVPMVPAEPMRWLPIILLTLIAIAAAAIGWRSFTQRDVG